MSILATRLARRALVALAALAAAVALLAASPAPASADYEWNCYPVSQAYWVCYWEPYGSRSILDGVGNRDLDIGAF
jgi:hypothetical protein